VRQLCHASQLERVVLPIFLLLVSSLVLAQPAAAATYYMSPTGNDANSGTSTSAPFATFSRAFSRTARGDTLILMDGVYHQQLFPNVPAVNPSNPLYITVKALNEGKAIIDGDGSRTPVNIEDYSQGNYMIFEGLVARNGVDTVWYIRKDHVIIRRSSGYNANVDTNSSIFLIWATSDVLIEDSIASGTGRKQFLAFQAQRVTFRRNFAMPTQWDGRRFCGVWWPYTSSFEFYQTSESIAESNIGYARADASDFERQVLRQHGAACWERTEWHPAREPGDASPGWRQLHLRRGLECSARIPCGLRDLSGRSAGRSRVP
jgi:hypothetical protein